MADQRRESDQRPSPEALLAKAKKEESRTGRLKIFLGAAPGVGKTYEMLQEARARVKDGADVVVGVVETHGRKETEALLDGLEVLPRRAVPYKDHTLDELIKRLKEGKVYVPKQAERALEHFFSPANLTALRELALRRTAERVDDQLLTQMQAGAISGPWAAGERILVCISEDRRAAGLVRYAKRLSDRLHGQWTALYVEGRRATQLTEEQRDRIADTLRL